MSEVLRVDAEKLQAAVAAIMEKEGVAPQDAAIVADSLVSAELTGLQSHGVQRVKFYTDSMEAGGTDPRCRMKTIRDFPGGALLDAQGALGIVAAYRYRFAMLNLCENPEIGVMEALNMSKAQTLGFKWQLFVLDLSFIGWNILVSLTLGILDIWVAPYRAQANIAFFQEIKKIKGVGFFPPRPEDDDQFRPHDPFGEDNW